MNNIAERIFQNTLAGPVLTHRELIGAILLTYKRVKKEDQYEIDDLLHAENTARLLTENGSIIRMENGFYHLSSHQFETIEFTWNSANDKK